jgi:hypothetical protein
VGQHARKNRPRLNNWCQDWPLHVLARRDQPVAQTQEMMECLEDQWVGEWASTLKLDGHADEGSVRSHRVVVGFTGSTDAINFDLRWG